MLNLFLLYSNATVDFVIPGACPRLTGMTGNLLL